MGFDKNSWKICFVLILLVVIVSFLTFSSVANAQINESVNEPPNQTNVSLQHIDPEILTAFENSTRVEVFVKYNGDMQVTLQNEEELAIYYANITTTKNLFSHITEKAMNITESQLSALSPSFVADITKEGFQRLANDSRVRSIGLVRQLTTFLNESISLIKNETTIVEIEEPKSWFSGIIDFFRSLFNAIFQLNESSPKNLSEINELNMSEEPKTNLSEIGTEEKTQESSNITNITCSYCQYLVNNSCINYSCCKGGDCETNETCVMHNCIPKTECPRSCDDRTNWTIDYCDTSTYLCEHIWIVPYCGNEKCELDEGENKDSCPGDCEGVIGALYCTKDSDCVPCCQSGSWDGEKMTWGDREPYGKCVNNNYNQEDVPTLCGGNTCQGYSGACIECNKCVNNQCVTTGAICPWA